jgi:hypothetical protein
MVMAMEIKELIIMSFERRRRGSGFLTEVVGVGFLEAMG